jgi:hypothetical protein
VWTYLEDRASHTTLWSVRYTRPMAEEGALRDQVAVAVTETLYNLHMSLKQRGLRLDPATRALHLRATAALVSSQQPFLPGEARRLLEQEVARAPNFAEAHGQLALTLLIDAEGAAPAEREALRRRARQEAELSLRLDPVTSASAYNVLFSLARLEHPLDIAGAERRYLLSRLDVSDQPWSAMGECRLQIELGRAREALPVCERGIALRPLATQVAYSHAIALQRAGDGEGAEREIDRLYRYYPAHYMTRRVRFNLALNGGRYERALAILAGPNHDDLTSEGRAAVEGLIRAQMSGAAADRKHVMSALWAAARNRQLDPSYVVIGAAMLGQIDDAFRALDDPEFTFSYGTGFLFAPPMAPVQRDPRFWRLAAKLGYLAYWRGENAWPDFCADQLVGIDCPSAATRAGV